MSRPVPIRAPKSGATIVAEIALAHGYHIDALKGRSQDEGVCRARARAMKALRDHDPKKWNLARIGDFFGGRSRCTVLRIISAHKEREKIVVSYLQQDGLIHEVEAQVRRITGLNLAHQVAHELSVPTWQAIFLAILMEAYEEATARLYQEAPGAMDSQIRTFSYHIRKRFTEMGLPDPVTAVRPRGFVLSYEAAVWLHNRFGRPLSIAARASA